MRGFAQHENRAVSSGVEHCIHTAGVGGSKPPPPTRNRMQIKDLAEMPGPFLLSGVANRAFGGWPEIDVECPNRATCQDGVARMLSGSTWPRSAFIATLPPMLLGLSLWSSHHLHREAMELNGLDFNTVSAAESRASEVLVSPLYRVDHGVSGKQTVTRFLGKKYAQRITLPTYAAAAS